MREVDSKSPFSFSSAGYTIRLAETASELDAILKMRFEVFNVELQSGLDRSYESGRDWDEFDDQCDHLVALWDATGEIVGTYRLQTQEHTIAAHGFYSGQEFDLNKIPPSILSDCVEMGRVCAHLKSDNQK